MADKAEKEVKKVMTSDEIRKIAPGYRGKPENFDPKKLVGKKKQVKETTGPNKTPEVPVPIQTAQGEEPTAMKKCYILDKAIFGVGVTVQKIHPDSAYFSANYSKVPLIAREVYMSYMVNDREIFRTITVEEMSYYATAMLWLRLLDIKCKQGKVELTTIERDLRYATFNVTFNVPKPLFTYLREIGSYKDKITGIETNLDIPPLPVHGGYHATVVDEYSHNLFEEVPSLGIAGDMIMAVASDQDEPAPNFRVHIPQGATFSENLVGRFHPIGPRRQEIRSRLHGYGITKDEFPEYKPKTRFNLRYLMSLSDIIGKTKTFKNEKVTFTSLPMEGGETQAIITKPIGKEEPHMNWNTCTVTATSATNSSTAVMGAAFMFGFQLFKEAGLGKDDTEKNNNWCCLQPTKAGSWEIDSTWIANRNKRRNLPHNMDIAMFQAYSMNQEDMENAIVRRMRQ